MAKQRIHSFGGRSHSTPFTRGGEGLNYVSRQTDGAYAAIANAITGTLSGVAWFDSTSSITSSPSFVYKDQESLYIIGALSATNAYTTILTPTTDDELASKYYVDQQVGGHNGTVSGISYFNTATSVTSDPDFYYDTSTNKMFVTSGSLSAVRLGRKDYVEPSLYSVLSETLVITSRGGMITTLRSVHSSRSGFRKNFCQQETTFDMSVLSIVMLQKSGQSHQHG
jgi:hypothetical protein